MHGLGSSKDCSGYSDLGAADMRVLVVVILLLSSCFNCSANASEAPLKSLGRFEGWRGNALIGYGIVVGLAGSGDSPRNAVTRQALSNVFSRFGAIISEADIASRNVAVVMAVAELPPSANIGDRLAVTVSSAGDARSLAGGALLLTPLLGPDGEAYALAQGALVTGGFSFEADLNRQQRNFPTTARVEGGATVERSVDAKLLGPDGEIGFFLSSPSFTTANRIVEAVNKHFGAELAWAKSADEVRIAFPGSARRLTQFLAQIESLTVDPDLPPRVVINERTGTIAAGGDVRISSVVIAQGDIRITIEADRYASQPSFIAGQAANVASIVVTNTSLDVSDQDEVVATFPNTTVADLVQGLNKAKVGARRIVSILQAVQAAGALHAELIVQ